MEPTTQDLANVRRVALGVEHRSTGPSVSTQGGRSSALALPFTHIGDLT